MTAVPPASSRSIFTAEEVSHLSDDYFRLPQVKTKREVTTRTTSLSIGGVAFPCRTEMSTALLGSVIFTKKAAITFQITEKSATWRRNSTSSLIKMVLSLLVENLLIGRGRGDDGQTEIRSCFGGNQDFPDAK